MEGKREPRTPLEILESALAKEKQARDFYADIAAHCSVPMIRDLAGKLQDEEYKHVRMIEQMLTRMRLGHDPA